ncbi:MAG: C10 family peptidase [Bacteroidales bacterium]|nr:C10 family peptidase [Bacteroidales bacterium]
MKRFSLILALVFMATMPTFAERMNSETAQKVATTFLNNNGVKSAQLTDLSIEAGFPNLYIFNAEPGFVVMAADDCVQPILGYSLTGKFIAKNMPANVSGWLQGYNDEIQYAIDQQLEATAETVQLWKDLMEGNSKAARATTVVNPLVQTTWDQNGFYYYSGGQLLIFELYNNLCPYDYNAGERTVTGCVATAMAQIMKYWNYPAHGIGSHSYTPSTHPEYGVQSANFGETTYAWSDMPNQLTSSSTNTQINAVATLMYHCGVSVDMMYDIGSNGGSGAYSEDIPYALQQYFNYKSTANMKYKSNYSDNNWINLLKTELNASRPIEYNGSGTGGHAFVCDGYNSSNQFHFNWGWSGNNDGFYSLTSLNPGSGGAGGGNYNFTNNQCAVIGIEPASTLPAPTNLTYSLNNTQDLTLTWNGVSEALSYNVYCNSNFIGNTTATTYAYTTPFGTNYYFVRAVDSYGQQSLPSNTVTVTVDYPTPIVDDLTATLSGNNINLSWTAPEWCYPATPSATLTYGDGVYSGNTLGFNNGSNMYWGHRYLASNLSAYNNMALYKAAFYANEIGAYKIYVYKGTVSNHPQTKVLEQSLNVGTTGWVDFDLSSTIIIDASKDYWVFMYDPEGRSYPATYSTYSGDDGNYYASSPTSWVGTFSGAAFLIKTYVTDGTYTYHLYRNGSPLALDLATTSYTDLNRNNTVSFYTVKTKYYGGVTAASNGVGYTLGQASTISLTLNANDLMTVTAGSKLTVSGTLSDVDASNLILENGAQLVNNSSGVKATVKKSINAYTQNGGWNLLASPILNNYTPTVNNGLLTNNYDLYSFDQSQDDEWRNYGTQSFDIGHKTGYLYANSGNPTLTFTGTLAANVDPTPLAYDVNASCKGFNLIGNPYPCNAYVNKNFYVLNSEGSNFTLGSNPIPPCAAILVQAQGTGERVTFSKTASKNEPNITFSVVKAYTKDNAILDKVRICFNETDQLAKYSMLEQGSRLYIPQNGQNLAVACAVGQNEMPIHFKAAQDATYTLVFEKEDLELKSLHLIDNLTGEVIDLLTMPSYTFEAKTTDPVERFKIAIE